MGERAQRDGPGRYAGLASCSSTCRCRCRSRRRFPVPIATYLNWPGHTLADWARSTTSGAWIEPGLSVPLAPFQELGAAAVVFICDCVVRGARRAATSRSPTASSRCRRCTSTATRARRCARRRPARPRRDLTLTATPAKAPTQAITAVLTRRAARRRSSSTPTPTGRGSSRRTAGVAFVQLARYFASLPAERATEADARVRRVARPHGRRPARRRRAGSTAHPDLVTRAAAALTVEHLGCTEWVDTLGRRLSPDRAGRRRSGSGRHRARCSSSPATRSSRTDLPRTALLRPPVQFGVGAAFQTTGVPQIGAIAGPEYLLTISATASSTSSTRSLAARQIAWLADLATRLDPRAGGGAAARRPHAGRGGRAARRRRTSPVARLALTWRVGSERTEALRLHGLLLGARLVHDLAREVARGPPRSAGTPS